MPSGRLLVIVVGAFAAVIVATASAAAQTPSLGPLGLEYQPGGPKKSVHRFAATAGEGYWIVIRNGDDGGQRLATATVKLNGRVVVSAADLATGEREVARVVPLRANNKLVVKFSGTQASTLTVTVSAEKPVLTVRTNPGDRMLFRAYLHGGSVVDYFGTRDERGLSLTVEEAVIRADSLETRVELDKTGMPQRIVASNEVVFQFESVSETEILVVAIAPDGTTQVSAQVQLSNPGRVKRSPASTSTLSGSVSDACVRVRACSSALPVADAQVSIVVDTGSSVSTRPAAHRGGGEYCVSIPAPSSGPGHTVREACEAIAEALDVTCALLGHLTPDDYQTICGAIGFAAAGVSGPGAIAITVACPSTLVTLQSLCVVGELASDGELGELLCQHVAGAVDEVFADTISLFPRVFVPGVGTVNGSMVTVPVNGPYPDFDVPMSYCYEGFARLSPLDPGYPGDGIEISTASAVLETPFAMPGGGFTVTVFLQPGTAPPSRIGARVDLDGICNGQQVPLGISKDVSDRVVINKRLGYSVTFEPSDVETLSGIPCAAGTVKAVGISRGGIGQTGVFDAVSIRPGLRAYPRILR